MRENLLDWNKNGKLDAADVMITELFEEELSNNRLSSKHEQYEDRKEFGKQNNGNENGDR